MLKITKGLKKKKKGKKSKNKDDDLFDSAELEQYRREQQQKQEAGTAETSEAGNSEKGEEWEKFKALTSGVDDILKKTQGDLDRIKSTSYFQKKPPGSSNETREVVKAEPPPPSKEKKWVGFEDSICEDNQDEAQVSENNVEKEEVVTKQEEAIVEEVEEEESELEDEQDDIFDTSYVDVVASGEVKLAYVPDSPIKEEDSFDPFDTSIVDKVIKTDPKKKNLVSLGCAVEVLTGKLEKTTGIPETLKSPRRRPKPQDLLLDSFDEEELQLKSTDVEAQPAPKSILDDDPVFEEETSAVLDFPSVPSNFDNKSSSSITAEEKPKSLDLKNLVEEFIPTNLTQETEKSNIPEEQEDDLDDEFAALAAESLAKKPVEKPPKPPRPELPNTSTAVEEEEEFDEFDIGDDPFDTSFAAQVLPGKFELKLIEKEILESDECDLKFKPTNQIKVNEKPSVDILVTNSPADFAFGVTEITVQEPLGLKHRDLLGGSTTDLSKISQSPIAPTAVEEIKPKEIENSDPFDTSIISNLVAPGKTELKFLEKELLAEDKPAVTVELDNDFDPRAEEKVTKPISRPDNLLVSNKRVSVPKIVAFDVKSPSNLPDLLAVGSDEGSKISKPLTPYYPPSNVQIDKTDLDISADPFDTSFVTNNPGKLELKLIEKELTSTEAELKRSLSDPDFDPRAEPNQDINIPHTSKVGIPTQELPDIISEEVQIEAKLHTPVTPRKITEVFEESEEFDPFDTSIANALAPGKAEIKILETELIYAKENPPINPISNLLTEALTSSLIETKPPTDVLEQPAEDITVKPLTPVAAASIDQEDIDPFDTSCVGAILPEELGNSQDSNNMTNFNPFLAGNEMQESSIAENPFSSNFNVQSVNNAFESANTNPFAFGAESEGSNSDFFSVNSKADESNTSINYENIFSSAPTQAAPTQVAPTMKDIDIFSATNTAEEVIPDTDAQQNYMQEDLISTADTSSTDIFSSQIVTQNVTNDSLNKAPPRRPPPPRPGPPKETKDLILSVTGAMEATSSHLLDRLQATRTPSPTPMRDLHSPSPTQFGDLLEVDEPLAPPPSAVSQDVNFLGDDFDFQAPVPQPISTEKRLSISEQSVTPVSPVKALEDSSPAIDQVTSTVTAPPMRPVPPVIPDRPKVPPQPSRPPAPVIPPAVPHNDIINIEPKPSQDTSFADVFGDELPIVPSAGGNTVSSLGQPAVPDSFGQPFLDNSAVKQQEDIFSTENENANIVRSDSTPFGDSKPTDLISDSNTFAEAENFNVQPFTDTSATFSDLSSNAFHDTDVSAPFSIQADTKLSNEFNKDFDITNANPTPQPTYNIFDTLPQAQTAGPAVPDEFDAFAAKFESVGLVEGTTTASTVISSDPFDPFSSAGFGGTAGTEDTSTGFGADDNFDTFLSLREPPPVPQGTPARVSRGESVESNDDNEFNIFIKPKELSEKTDMLDNGPMPALAPPPKSPSQANAFQDTSPRFNPFDSTQEIPSAVTENIFAQVIPSADERQMARTDSQETPPTPLFDEDVSQPLEDFPRIHYDGPGWEMQLRQPNKKKITGQRFWKKIFVKLVYQGENPVLQLFNGKDDKDPFQELPLQPCYSVSEIGAQQYDQYGKIFTIKLQFIYYKERPGVRPGQVTKAERITNKLSQFAAYAIQGDYQGVKEFGSDLKKLGLPVEHAPQISQLFKIGSQSYEDMKQFSMCIEEALFRLSAHRDRALNYKMEEVQITAVDELYVEQNANGGVDKQIARVRLFFLGFLSGMPDVELGVNDLVRQGKEVVGRHDIIPVVTEEWIRLENVEFHSCVQQDEYENTRTIKFKPPDACYIELMRFRIRPPKNRELPLQLKCTICVTGNKVEIHGDILVPGFTSRKLGQIPCEDVMVRIPIPECWIYQFRVEKHFRYGSVKSAHRRTGKVKGIERFLGAIENMEPSLMEVTSGQAKYEHQHRAIVWRMPRLPKEGQGAYTTHNLVVRLQLTSYDQIPEELAKYCYLEFTMPATTVSHTTVRSVSIANSDSDAPPEKYVRQLARHEYRIEIEHTQGEAPSDYIAATVAKHPPPVPEEPKPAPPAATSDSDSDSG